MPKGRKQLGKMEGQRRTFTGIFDRFGKKPAYQGGFLTTVCLTNITDVETGKVVADHLWFNLTVQFDNACMVAGDIVQFDARVEEYTKGYQGTNWERQLESPVSYDWKLTRPTKVTNLSATESNGDNVS